MLTELQATLKQKGFAIFTRPFELNIIGIRANSTKPNAFDDAIHLFYTTQDGRQQFFSYKATTDPGTFWLQNPLNPQGTAILKEGQYKNTYALGLHRGKYLALVQVRPVTVMRDYDRNAVLDFMNGKEQTGLFGINIHRALETGTTKTIDKFSAGCQVFANASDFQVFMQLCERHKQFHGNSFTYTLLDERALVRETKKK